MVTTDIDDGGPAFPAEDFERWYDGMSLRDWFAGQSLAGTRAGDTPDSLCDSKVAAERAYEDADAMIRAREARP